MASIPRSSILKQNSTWHVTWQCHNKDFLLKENWAKQIYYDLLLKYKDRYQVSIYSYCLMSNHIHLSGRHESLESFSDFFRTVNSLFARKYNKIIERRGQVVMDRFKSPRIQSDADLLKVMTYHDLNPHRAKMVKHPKDNVFSSFAYYAYGRKDPLITAAPSYLILGKSEEKRQQVYLKLIALLLKSKRKKKANYSSTLFIGDPDWVLKNKNSVSETRKMYLIDWKKRFKERYST